MAALPPLAIASLVVSSVSAAYAAYAQRQAGNFQAEVAKRNAEMQEVQAKDAEARGLEEGVRVALAGGHTRGAIRAGFGASGVTVNEGSALDVLADAALYGELDKQTVRANAAREAFAFRVGAGNYLAQANLARSSGRTGAASTLLTGASQFAGDYYRYRKT
jgi:hypothetical protein